MLPIKLLFFFTCLTIGSSAIAQINDYKTTDERVLREREEARSRALRDKAFTPNTPSPKGSSYGDLVEEKRAKAAREAEYQQQKEQNLDAERLSQQRVNEDYKRRQDESMRAAEATDKRREQAGATADARWEPIRQQYKVYSFLTDKDRDALAKQTINENGTRLPNANDIEHYPAYYQQYLNLAKTGSYEEVMASILKFERLTNKAEDALEALANRFPSYQKQIDDAMVSVWRLTAPSALLDDPGSVLRLAKRQPYATLNSLDHWEIPTKPLLLKMYDAHKDPAFDKNALIAIEKEYVDVVNAQLLVFFGDIHLKEYLASLSLEELLAVGRKKGVSPCYLLNPTISRASYRKMRSGDQYKLYYQKTISYYGKSHPLFKVWQFFAEAGDADAMDLYAGAITYGYTKERKSVAAEWHRKAEVTRSTDGYYQL